MEWLTSYFINKSTDEPSTSQMFHYIKNNNVSELRSFCKQASNNTLTKLLEQTDDYGNTALLMACYKGRYEASCVLLEAGASIKAMNYFGQNALTLATHSGRKDLVVKLLCYRSYDDFNASSIIPAICVAAMRQNDRLMEFFASLDRYHGQKLHTSHGLTARDIYAIFR